MKKCQKASYMLQKLNCYSLKLLQHNVNKKNFLVGQKKCHENLSDRMSVYLLICKEQQTFPGFVCGFQVIHILGYSLTVLSFSHSPKKMYCGICVLWGDVQFEDEIDELKFPEFLSFFYHFFHFFPLIFVHSLFLSNVLFSFSVPVICHFC